MINQILSVDNGYSKNKKTRKAGPTDIKKIVKFFSIVIIMFAIGIIGMSSYAFVDSNSIFSFGKPELVTERAEDKLKIKINSKKEIDKITYRWSNSEELKEIDENGETQIEELVELPVGNNTITINVYDLKGKTYSYSEDYSIENEAPQLSIAASNGKLKVIAKDNEKMENIRYKWDDDEEIIVNATEESSAQIEVELDIPKGTHTLSVVAVNSRKKETQRNQEVKGVTKPIINVVQDSSDLKYLVLTVSDENAVKLVEYDLNGKKYKIDLSNKSEKAIQYRQVLDEGHNLIKITATNFDNAQETFEGECTYNP